MDLHWTVTFMDVPKEREAAFLERVHWLARLVFENESAVHLDGGGLRSEEGRSMDGMLLSDVDGSTSSVS